MLESPILWLFVAPGLLLGFYAQWLIKASYTKYSRVATEGLVTGAQAARWLLDSQGLHYVKIDATPGMLSDHYDPRSRTLRLSQEVYNTPSVAAIGIAAHEAGHALQDAADYLPLELRSYIVPAVQTSAKIAPWLVVGGLVLGIDQIAWVGIVLFGAQTFFTLLTLPVEFDASARAQELLIGQGIVSDEAHATGVRQVLRAAAWTYVAGAISALGSLFYVIFILLSSARRTR
jgi:Zn-dependent membrane protease YugP